MHTMYLEQIAWRDNEGFSSLYVEGSPLHIKIQGSSPFVLRELILYLASFLKKIMLSV